MTMIRRGVPSLKETRDHYRRMSEDPDISKADRYMWGVLADEIDRRLNEGGADDGTQTLLF